MLVGSLQKIVFVAVALSGVSPAFACDEPSLFSAVMLDPGNIELSMDYGECALENGDLESAVSTFERVLIYDPDNGELEVVVAGLYALMKADDLAAQHYEAALSSTRISDESMKVARAGLAGISSSANEGFSLTTYSAYRYQDNVNLGLRSSTVNIGGTVFNVPLSLQGRADPSFWHEGNAAYQSGEIANGISMLAEAEWQLNKQEMAFPLEAMAIEGRIGPVFKLGSVSSAMEGWLLYPYVLAEKTLLYHQPLYGALGGGLQLNKSFGQSHDVEAQVEYRRYRYDNNVRRPTGSTSNGFQLDGSLSVTKYVNDAVNITTMFDASRFDVVTFSEDYWSAGVEMSVSWMFGEFGAGAKPAELTFGGGFEFRDFDDVATGALVSSRQDLDYWIEAAIDIPLTEKLSFVPKMEYLNASSDVVLGNYYATSIMAGLSTVF